VNLNRVNKIRKSDYPPPEEVVFTLIFVLYRIFSTRQALMAKFCKTMTTSKGRDFIKCNNQMQKQNYSN